MAGDAAYRYERLEALLREASSLDHAVDGR